MPDNSNTKVILLVYLIQLSCLSILWPSRDCFKCPFVRSKIISRYSIVKLNLDNFACLLNSLTSIYNRFYVYFILVQRLFFLYTTMYIFKSAYSCEDLNFFRRLLGPSRTPLGLSRVYMQRNTRRLGEEMT